MKEINRTSSCLQLKLLSSPLSTGFSFAIHFSRAAIVRPLLITAFGKLNKVNELQLHKKSNVVVYGKAERKQHERRVAMVLRRKMCEAL